LKGKRTNTLLNISILYFVIRTLFLIEDIGDINLHGVQYCLAIERANS
jgi:hypothetical protein